VSFPTPSKAISQDRIRPLLRTDCYGRSLLVLDTTTSTNRVAFEMAHQGAPHGTVVVADCQTGGQGRHGRIWHSPPGMNLYCSLLLRLPESRDEMPKRLGWVPLLSGLAAARAVSASTPLEPGIKWPNDLLVNGRKLGGILCESAGLGTASPVLVVGIGINVNQPRSSFAPEIQDRATSLFSELDSETEREQLFACLLYELENILELLIRSNSAPFDDYRSRCLTLGQRVRISLAVGTSVEGLAHSIGPDGSLTLRASDDSLIGIQAGDVTHLRAGDRNTRSDSSPPCS
jgi:BirA family biotin operon repressor/biotin-[acetyl-CoA-carboxylase] ligase